jgi:hypothetical protein
MSSLRVNTIQNTSGVEQYLAKAWVNFNGTGTVAIRAAGNVSSIVDMGVGAYYINMTNAVASNYAVIANANRTTPGTDPTVESVVAYAFPISTTQFGIGVSDNNSDTSSDAIYVAAAIFR